VPRVLVPGAGSGSGNNLIRSLRAGDRSIAVVGCHDDRFTLKKSAADRNHLVPHAADPGFIEALRRVVRRERIDLVMPNSDLDVRTVSLRRARLPCRVFLPRHAVVRLCQDKYALTAFLAARDVPVPRTYPVTSRRAVATIFRRLGRGRRVWCRIREGSGSRGAVPVTTAEQALNWLRFWEEMRGVAPTAFTLAEYLPGRDFACQSLWKDGELVLIKTCERISYFGGGSQPSGASSIAALARTVVEPRVVDVCVAAVRALGRRISGAFSVDLRENVRGVPCITEINVGRFITMMNLFDLTGKHNMADTYVRLALDQPTDIAEAYDTVEDYYFIRDVDTVPGIHHADEFFEGILDARRRQAPRSRGAEGR
jgi:glutathione synthase/RimK-type ligase-like ATP-grasp enzyme